MSEPTYPPPTSEPCVFFVPGATTEEMAEDAWQGLRRSSGSTTERRVQRIQYNNHRGVYTSEVGYLENDDEFEWVTTAIFEPSDPSSPWLISIMRIQDGAPVWRDPPILVSASDILQVTDFLTP